ncbi:Hypothetical_protein [Hexamita inflata]|uniref:Hypothetical_protein n=1 Tax=Hexamita inflata TaxID=28002 RepID=A0AA86UHN6_9EUKA|nr:Hypothetical protein HINF_LOCUS43784 [Hexamita inflata]
MRLGQIGCGSQNLPVQSAKLPLRIGMLRAYLIGLESGNHSIASLETQMVRHRWIPVQIGLHKAAALRPWMLVPESLVALGAEVRLTYIGVSKTNDHSHELTVSYTEDRTSINESQVSGIYIKLTKIWPNVVGLTVFRYYIICSTHKIQ